MRTLDIPFAGFYSSEHEGALDSEVYSYASHLAECHDVNESAAAEAILGATDWQATQRDAAAEYARIYCGALDNLAGWPLRLQFVRMVSPREYNFTTDRLEARVSRATARRMRREVDSAKLDAIAAKRHTSRSGFISFYSSDWREWGPVDGWDHVQLSTLLLAWVESHGYDDHAQTLEDEAREHMQGNSGYELAVDENEVLRALGVINENANS